MRAAWLLYPLIGVFVISEVIVQAEKAAKVTLNKTNPALVDQPDSNYFTWNEFKKCFPIMCRSSIIGSVIGMMPGLGSSVACFVAYGEEKDAKTPEKWGTGIVEGVAAPESANNAVSGPSMIPLLSLGIPGSTIAAVLIGVFIIHGLQVGPQIFDDQNQIIVGVQVMTSREFIFALFAAGLVGIAAYGIIGYWAAPLIGRTIALIPQNYLYPFIFATAIAASFSSRSSIADVGFAIFFGVIGYGMRRTNFSAAAFIIAFVLAGNMEEAFRQAMMISDNGLLDFVTEPISASFLAIGLGMLAFRISKQLQKIKLLKIRLIQTLKSYFGLFSGSYLWLPSVFCWRTNAIFNWGIIGSACFVWSYERQGRLILRLPPYIRSCAVGITGAMIGSRVPPTLFEILSEFWVSALMMIPFVLFAHIGNYKIFRHIGVIAQLMPILQVCQEV